MVFQQFVHLIIEAESLFRALYKNGNVFLFRDVQVHVQYILSMYNVHCTNFNQTKAPESMLLKCQTKPCTKSTLDIAIQFVWWQVCTSVIN